MTYSTVIHLLYLLNGCVIGTVFLWSFTRQRLYSLLWAALLVFHSLSYLDLNTLERSFSLSTLFKGQMLMLMGNSVLTGTLLFFDKGPLSILPRGNQPSSTAILWRKDDNGPSLPIRYDGDSGCFNLDSIY